jgi:hypothetical protein
MMVKFEGIIGMDDLCLTSGIHSNDSEDRIFWRGYQMYLW